MEKRIYKRKPKWYSSIEGYHIAGRYQHRTSNGIEWTRWFLYMSNKFDNVQDAEEVIKKEKKKDIFGLNREYKVITPEEANEMLYGWCEIKTK